MCPPHAVSIVQQEQKPVRYPVNLDRVFEDPASS
jgi:hypothetical protein